MQTTIDEIAPVSDGALERFRGVIGAQWVLSSPDDRRSYHDPYAFDGGPEHEASAILAPQSVEEIQAILRIANEEKTPLWPVGRGKNLGYGAAAPVLRNSLILDLSRMNRILDVDEKSAHCLLEPGVGFFDLYDHLQANNIPLWMSVPGNSWGSVIGNALDRGIGYTPYGDHCDMLCGLEVVLPDGDVIRTGMGAMDNTSTWQHYRHGYGPGWEQMFVQSSLGVVTKGGLWLQPEPEMTAKTEIRFPKFEDAEWAIDVLADLRRRDIIQHNIVFGSPVRAATVLSQRADWYEGKGAIPDAVCEEIMAKFNLGWWTGKINVQGHAEIVEASMKIIRAAIEPRLGKEVDFEVWRKGDPISKSARGVPTTIGLQAVNWYGGRGGHIGFAPVMPSKGAEALAFARKMKAIYDEVGQDYYTTFTIGRRHINNVNLLLYDRDDIEMVTRVKSLFTRLVDVARAEGYAEYRGHIDFMDMIADTYDFNDHALRRLNDKVKKTLDPNNIIAPGRNGISPYHPRKERAE